VTLDELVHHTAGIPDYEEALGLDSDRYAQFMAGGDNIPRILDQARAKPLDFAPGTRFHYSNTGYLLLGAAIERVSGMSYAEYLRDHVFAPLGMADSGIIPAGETVPHLATGYSAGDNGTAAEIAAGIPLLRGRFVRTLGVSIMAGHADGGLYTTVDDLFAWDRALARATLLPAGDTAELFAPRLGSYAFGWVIGQRLGLRNESHNGVLPGFVARIDRYPDARVTVIVLANLATSRFSQTSRDLAAIVLARPYDVPSAHRIVPRDTTGERVLAGTYRMDDGSEATIRPGARFLEMEVPERFVAGLLPEGPRVFYVPFLEGTAAFTLGASGAAETVRLHYNGEDHAGRRVR
jgi:CubicO group peptidase (beta-lactamase class C family)